MEKQLAFWDVWEVVDHACRHCGGRVLVRNIGKKILARCAECGATGDNGHASVCCCGADLGALGRVLECVRNPAISKASPYQVLVRERLVEKDAEAAPARTSKPVRVEGY